MTKLEFKDAGRGLKRAEFRDANGELCSIQMSSSAGAPHIWLGCNEGTHLRGECMARMHLNQEQVKSLLPAMENFVASGVLQPNDQKALLSNAIFVLQQIHEDWNKSFDCKIGADVIIKAADVIEEILDLGTPLPSIVPSNDGIQFEWHCCQVDFEITISSTLTISASYEDLTTGEEWDGCGILSCVSLRPFISVITKRHKAKGEG